MPLQSTYTHTIKANRVEGGGCQGLQTSAIPIQKQEKHIRRTYYEYWIHAYKKQFLNSWLSDAPRATHSFDRKNKYDIYVSVLFLVQPVQLHPF